MLAIAAADPRRITTTHLAVAERIPPGFLRTILLDLRRAGLLNSHRGADGGYGLARPPAGITVGDILRVAGGTLTSVRGRPPAQASYDGAARGLRGVWLSVDTAISDVVDQAT